MLRLALAMVLFWFGDVGAGFADAASAAPTGRWITANRAAVVQIAPCGADMCGEIVGLAQTEPGPMPTDWRGKPQCGEVIMETAPSLDASGNTVWQGKILDPRNGSVYQASIALDADRHLRLHGYIGLPIFGQTQIWTPYSGRTMAGCRLGGAAQASG